MTFDVDVDVEVDDSLAYEYVKQVQQRVGEKIKQAARLDYDYVYHHTKTDIGFGDMKPETRVWMSDYPPESIPDDVFEGGLTDMYDLSELTDDEREKIADGEVPESLERL